MATQEQLWKKQIAEVNEPAMLKQIADMCVNRKYQLAIMSTSSNSDFDITISDLEFEDTSESEWFCYEEGYAFQLSYIITNNLTKKSADVTIQYKQHGGKHTYTSNFTLEVDCINCTWSGGDYTDDSSPEYRDYIELFKTLYEVMYAPGHENSDKEVITEDNAGDMYDDYMFKIVNNLCRPFNMDVEMIFN
jgi:hypothetical protein